MRPSSAGPSGHGPPPNGRPRRLGPGEPGPAPPSDGRPAAGAALLAGALLLAATAARPAALRAAQETGGARAAGPADAPAGADSIAPASREEGRPWQAWARDGLAFASLFALDRPLRAGARELEDGAPEGGALDEVADRAEWFGDWEGSLPWVVGGAAAVGGITGGYEGLKEGGAVLAGVASAAFANEALNRAVGRGRPSWGEGSLSLRPFRGHASFPSGHTAYVFSVASGVDVVTDGWLPAAAAYGVAGMTGLSRIYHDQHWLTDVAAGAALATVVSRAATRRALSVLGVRRGGGGQAGGGVRVDPLATPGLLGVALRH